MRRLLIAAACLLAAGPAWGQGKDPAQARLEKSPRHHEYMKVKTDKGREVKCFMVFPETDKATPAVVVIHENKGLTDWVRSAADQVAEAGYLAVAPDLLSGTGPGGGDTDAFASDDAARAGIYKLEQGQVVADLDAVVAHTRKLKACSGKVAVAGFCWGGGQAFHYATVNPKVAAAFVFYGTAPKEGELKDLQAPVYGFYGGKDFRITGQVPQVKQQLKELGKTYEPVTYEGAGHGFMRSGEEPGADEANRRARDAAWERWRMLLGKL